MVTHRHDRVFPLGRLNAYPGSPVLDVPFWLPPADDMTRRVWLSCPAGEPHIAIDDAALGPERVVEGSRRWVDYGAHALPAGFTQLRIRGLDPSVRDQSFLVVSADRAMDLAGCSIEEAERRLWGLSRAEAGTTTITPCRVEVGMPVDFTVRYTAGAALPPGALVRFRVPKLFSPPQTDDASAPGFTRILDGRGGARVSETGPCIESHEKNDILVALAEGLSPGEGFTMGYRTDRTYIFPILLREVDCPYWYTRTAPLSAAVALGPDRAPVSLADGNSHMVEFVAGAPCRLHLMLPGRRHADERLLLRGVVADRFRNVPPTGPVTMDVELFLQGPGADVPLGTPAGALRDKHRFVIELPALEPGVYRAVARAPGSDRVVARSNPMEVVATGSGANRIYWGEIHAHTEMSDGSGDFAGLYRHARAEGGLDFAAASDHACYFSDNQWETMQDITNGMNDPCQFVTLIGYEWAGKEVHRNVYTSRRRLQLFRGMYGPTSHIETVWKHFHGDKEVVGGPHGTLAHGLVWTAHDPTVERFVEIYSMWGANDFRDNPLVTDASRANPRAMTANELLQSGAKLGFTGGGDCHEGHAGFSCEDPAGQGATPHTFAAPLKFRCGMTAIVAPKLTRVELIKSIRNRQTYATTGARILLSFSVAETPMGAEVSTRSVTCDIEVHGTERLARMDIVKDGRVVWSIEADALDVATSWSDPEPPRAQHYYYLHVVQKDGEMAWSSPVWVRPPGKGEAHPAADACA